MTKLENAVAGLLEQLERISKAHEELTDTDVRESMHLTLTNYFVWGQERARFPRSFGMFSADGDALVANALVEFLEAAEISGELAAISVGQQRLDVLQADGVSTASGMRYDEFVGHRETPLPAEPLPQHMFSGGDYPE